MKTSRHQTRRRRTGLRIASLSLPIVAVLLSGGCARLQRVGIVDQRTFDPKAGIPPKPHLPPAPPGRPGPGPLITIANGTPQADWEGPLRSAIAAALARKSNVLFELRQSVPAGATPDETASAAQAAARGMLAPIAQAIVADGASIAQVQVGAAATQLAPGSKGGVQIFLH